MAGLSVLKTLVCAFASLNKIEMLRHGTELGEIKVLFKRGGGKKKETNRAATLCSILLQSLEGRRASVLPREDTVHAPV